MSLYCAAGGVDCDLAPSLQSIFAEALEKLGDRKRVLAVPPDFTRFHSGAGALTRLVWKHYGDRLQAVLPALGTHSPMSSQQISRMFGEVPPELIRVHNWRTSVETLGDVPSSFIAEQSEGKLNYSWPVQTNRLILQGGFDLILSIGQVVPHEVAGMANHSKNVLIGCGGREAINRSHYLGAVYGMERIMGRAANPVRNVFNYASQHFLKDIPIVYVLTVVGRTREGRLATRGLFVGDDVECFNLASELSLKVNFDVVDKPFEKVVVYLDPDEYHSTWLGNKAIYRTRMALADGAELIILAPGVKEFGEDKAIDGLIRKYGYRGTPATLDAVSTNSDMAGDLSAAAHLIHGSSEGRFTIRWCPGQLSEEEVRSIGYEYGELRQMLNVYDLRKMACGYNRLHGADVYFIDKPGLGLWAHVSKLEGRDKAS